MFGYSDEEGTEAAGLPGHHDEGTVAGRVTQISGLVEQLTAQRAEERVGETVEVLVEDDASDDAVGRAEHQAPEVDGECILTGPQAHLFAVGDLVRCRVVGAQGVDLVVEPVGLIVPAGGAP